MKKKVMKQKQKQKQKQSQKVIVNISRAKTSKEQPRSLLPMSPSFNINQPQSSSDLAKLVGLLIPKLQTESTLGKAISVPVKNLEPKKEENKIGNLESNKKESLLFEAINNKTIFREPIPLEDEPIPEASFIPEASKISESEPLPLETVRVPRLNVPAAKKPKSSNEPIKQQTTITSFFPLVSENPSYEETFGLGPFNEPTAFEKFRTGEPLEEELITPVIKQKKPKKSKQQKY